MLTTERKLTRRQRRLKRRRIRGLVNAHKRVDLIYARTDRAILKGFDRGIFERVARHETSLTEAQGETLHNMIIQSRIDRAPEVTEEIERRRDERAVLAYPDEYLVVADKDGDPLPETRSVEYGTRCPTCGAAGPWSSNPCLTESGNKAKKAHAGRLL